MVMKRKKKYKSRAVLYDTDLIAKNIWLSLLRDFRSEEGHNFASGAERSFLTGIADYREYVYPELGIISPGRFKRYKQLSDLLKKYRFQKDLFTDEELEEKSHANYLREQERLCSLKPVGQLDLLVIQRARKISRAILGEFNPEYAVTFGRFGRKSSIGCPLSLAYIDHKLTDVKAFTSSSQCARWFFDEVVHNDPILKELVDKLGLSGSDSANLAHDSLNLVLVPKSWKTHRVITPLTLLTLFYSYGVGEQVQERLCDVGLDIRRLQQRHRVLVKHNSKTCRLATADLSAASDSLTSELINRILPREWVNAIRKTYTHQVHMMGTSVYTASILPMGNGLTFPVETLAFYVLLKAIAELSGVRGFISVYGDDLIYPAKLHKYVSRIFPRLGLKLNLDKTFVKAPFRESCGSDYYRGCDVRPAFLPEAGHSLTRTDYVTWLYKTYNSLTRRWSEFEIRSTLLLILKEIACNSQKLYRVPPDFPDTAGIKVLSPEVIPLDAVVLDWSPIDCYFNYGSVWYDFSYLSVSPVYRQVVSVLPYYWLSLRKQTDAQELDNFWEKGFDPRLTAPRQSLNWKALKCVRYSSPTSVGKRKRFVLTKYLATCVTHDVGKATVVTTKSSDRHWSTRSGSRSVWA